MGYTKPIKKEFGIKTQICDLYALFSKYKGISDKYSPFAVRFLLPMMASNISVLWNSLMEILFFWLLQTGSVGLHDATLCQTCINI
jgi:hypothetical protein